jgi:hypothetical protein
MAIVATAWRAWGDHDWSSMDHLALSVHPRDVADEHRPTFVLLQEPVKSSLPSGRVTNMRQIFRELVEDMYGSKYSLWCH